MKKYLSELHTKPDKHKKRFALLFSLGFTLLVFGVWSLVMFGPASREVTEDDAKKEPNPLASLGHGAAAAIQAIRGDFDEVKDTLEAVNTYGER